MFSIRVSSERVLGVLLLFFATSTDDNNEDEEEEDCLWECGVFNFVSATDVCAWVVLLLSLFTAWEDDVGEEIIGIDSIFALSFTALAAADNDDDDDDEAVAIVLEVRSSSSSYEVWKEGGIGVLGEQAALSEAKGL